MLNIVKGFWNSLSIRDWTIDGRALANPFQIIRRVTFIGPITMFKWLYLFSVLLGWGIDEYQYRKSEFN